MSDEQINVAIAEACGWKNCKVLPKPQKYWDVSDVPEMCRIGSPPVAGSCTFPNYCNDLNVMYELEKKLSDDERWEQIKLLVKYDDETAFPLLSKSEVLSLANATARQHAETFLQILNKQKE